MSYGVGESAAPRSYTCGHGCGEDTGCSRGRDRAVHVPRTGLWRSSTSPRPHSSMCCVQLSLWPGGAASCLCQPLSADGDAPVGVADDSDSLCLCVTIFLFVHS